jgi:hypothetical protein
MMKALRRTTITAAAATTTTTTITTGLHGAISQIWLQNLLINET